jgi:biopolymer transport protein ExbD
MNVAAEFAHRRKMRAAKRRNEFYCRIDPSPFAAVLWVLLFLFMGLIPTYRRGAVDLPRASQSIPLPGARRDDALLVNVTRDGGIYFHYTRIAPEELTHKIRDGMIAGAERQVYISADARAKYKDVKQVLELVRAAGVENVSFFTMQ